MVEEKTENITDLIQDILTKEQIKKLEEIYYFEQFCDDVKLAQDAQSLSKEVESYFSQANISKQETSQICNAIFEKYEELQKQSQQNEEEEEKVYAQESDEEQMDGQCELCLQFKRITLHHAIPKLIIKRMMKKKKVKRADLVKFIKLCSSCHAFVHKTFPHAELAKKYHTIEALVNSDELQDYVKKVRKQKN